MSLPSSYLPITWIIATNNDVLFQTRVNAHTAMAIPMMGYILALIFPIYVNIYKKDSMDLHRNTEINVKGPTAKELELEEGNHGKPTATNVETIEP
jgi:FHS family L-fucose permease-like MFS transporter